MPRDDSDEKGSSFEALSKGRPRGAFLELLDFLKSNKKWWLTPIIVMLLVLGAVIVLGSTGAAPFIYTLF